MKKTRVLMLIVGLVLSGTVVAADATTEHWHKVNKSITALLNEGWTIGQYSVTLRDEEAFILVKTGKYIRCKVVTDPVNNESHAARSYCDSLN